MILQAIIEGATLPEDMQSKIFKNANLFSMNVISC